MEITQLIKELESSIPGLAPGTLQPGTRFRELPVWDSLATLTLLSVVDGQFGCQLNAEQLRGCADLQQVFELAQRLRRL